jgi:tetratricopeptide (TPR) repeat protein
MPVKLRYGLSILTIVIVASCSTQKNTLVTRAYHQTTARYNTFFNGRESFRSGVRRSEQQFRYDYNRILPVFLYTDPDIARSVSPEMDRAINKASKIISNKSITARPAGNRALTSRSDDFLRQSEYNKWVRESYLLAGKAHFYKHDFSRAAQAFLFITREYSMNAIKYDGKIWLARTYSERERYHEARMLAEEMLADPDFPSRLNGDLYSTIADIHLKQDQFEQAIVNLEKALESTGDKDVRTRYSYILAQLNERTGNLSTASAYYSRVIRMNPPYEMVFNARINLAGVIQSGQDESVRMIAELERMLRDEKNRDYQDQVYFAMGNIHLRNGNPENAVNYFTRSAATNGLNPSQKTLAYLALGGIFFKDADYLVAQPYYDSAVMHMNQGFPGYHSIIEKSNVLSRLVENVRLYRLEDSVQLLAAMSEPERNRKVDEIIAMERKNEADARQREQLATTSRFQSARVPQTARRQIERQGEGNWYFYNQAALTFGQNEFEMLWGNRRLEDNWRRSNRQIISEQMAVNDEPAAAGEEVKQSADTRDRESYMRNIPLTDEAMHASHLRLADALFNMGVIYRDDLKDYINSVHAFDELVNRYPEGILTPSASYNLYSLHLKNGNTNEAERYKKIIISKYPSSNYAGILTNPDFFLEREKKMQEAEKYYEDTFTLFRENRHEQVRERTAHAIEKWPESSLVPLFEYLNVLSAGALGNIPLFRTMLADYISRYPETEMAEDANNFIAYLETDYPELTLQEDSQKFPGLYEQGQNGAHHFVLIIDNRQDLINRMVFNIINFNVDNFALHDLNISSEQFSTNYHLIRVDGLPDIPAALNYLRKFSVSPDVIDGAGENNFTTFVVSPRNLDLFMQDKNIASYLKFFETEYLGRY